MLAYNQSPCLKRASDAFTMSNNRVVLPIIRSGDSTDVLHLSLSLSLSLSLLQPINVGPNNLFFNILSVIVSILTLVFDNTVVISSKMKNPLFPLARPTWRHKERLVAWSQQFPCKMSPGKVDKKNRNVRAYTAGHTSAWKRTLPAGRGRPRCPSAPRVIFGVTVRLVIGCTAHSTFNPTTRRMKLL